MAIQSPKPKPESESTKILRHYGFICVNCNEPLGLSNCRVELGRGLIHDLCPK